MPGHHFFFFKKKKNQLNFTPELTIVTFLFAKFYLARSLNPPNFPLKQIREAPLNISGFLSLSFFLDGLLQGTSFACSSPAVFSHLLQNCHTGLLFTAIPWGPSSSLLCWSPVTRIPRLPLSCLSLFCEGVSHPVASWEGYLGGQFGGHIESQKCLCFTHILDSLVWYLILD